MKKGCKLLVLVALFVGTTLPAWAQSTTEGKEFWVALTLSAAPSSGTPTPFIAVSTKKPTKITITNPNDPSWAGVTRTAGANSWEVFDTNNIPLKYWYPTNASSIANIKPEAGKTHNFGLKVETDEDVSVFAALWMENSFDAANILPVHVLQYEYYVQDYPPYIKPSDGDALSMFTILAAEDNARITITPTSETQDGHPAGVPYFISLSAGQTYYVISKTLESLSGTHVESNDTKIAIFQGDVFTQIPGGKSARDCLYEQAMPVDYWGTKFVVTRSKEKDANRIRVTASNDNTYLRIQDKQVAYLNAGETWEFEMHKTQPTQQNIIHLPDAEYEADALFLQATCPVAVYSYDVSNGYKADPTEMDNSRGDPSMVWIAPLEQRINDITFGVCGTSKTDKHYIDIVCQTATTAQTTITPAPKDPLTWTVVPGKEEWSYARIHLSTVGKTGAGNRVFTMKNPSGCIAHVYGNGNDESYAYSVGSAAVKQGVYVEEALFQDGTISDSKFCFGKDSLFTFDANVGTDEVKRVDWNFGDGTVMYDGPATIDHKYTSPGWYDVTAALYGVPPCSGADVQYVHLGDVKFSFQVVSAEYKYVGEKKDCKEIGYTGPLSTTLDTVQTADCWLYEISITHVGVKTEHYDTIKAKDSYYEPLNGTTYPLDPDNPNAYHIDIEVNLGEINQYACDSILHRHIDIVTCLHMGIPNDSGLHHACYGDSLIIPFTYVRGDIGETTLILGDKKVKLEPDLDNKTFELPTQALKPGVYSASISVVDPNCDTTLVFPVDFAIYYPADIFKYKFNNVLAVYNPGYGGNKDIQVTFTAYQWYKDGQAIPDATEPVYHTEDQIPVGEYYVLLTDAKGQTLPSCSQNITARAVSSEPAGAPAQKILRDGQICIQVGDILYDIYGQRVQ